jgi:eukaryotic-like serine/threonine-protein kinase
MEDISNVTTLGRYRLARRIGRGGMGEVWLAEDPHLLRQVALKVLPLRKRDDEEFLLRFEREARAAAALHHPHILPVHDYGQQQMPDNQAITYLVMSYVSGGSLDDRLKLLSNGQRALTQEEALTFLFQVAEAIDYAHAHQIVHRDIKPANMLLRDDNWLLLTDFGIARILYDADVFATGTYLGTPTYMAPEQAQGHAVPASDIYSLAVVAYQLFTGRLPFQADNPLALSFQHAFSPPVAPRVYNPALSPEFEVALLRGLEKDPAQRPRSATIYVTSLDQTLKLFPSSLPSPVQSLNSSVTPKPGASLTRRKVLRGAGIGAGVLLVAGGATTYLVSSLLHRNPIAVKPITTTRATVPAASNAPLAISAAFTSPVTFMAWTPGKNTLATYSKDKQLVLWDLTSAQQSSAPRQLAHLNAFIAESVLLSWSPDGKMLAASNWGFDGNTEGYETLVYAADLSGLMPAFSKQTLIENQETVRGASWMANNFFLTSASTPAFDTTQLTLWNMSQPGKKAFSFKVDVSQPLIPSGRNGAAVSPNGATLALGVGGGLLLGHLDTTGKAALWQQIGSQLSLDNNDLGEVAWSPDGRYVAAELASPASNGVVCVWDASRQYQSALPALAASSVPTSVVALAWSPTSSQALLALGGEDGQVYLWHVGSSPQPARILTGGIQGRITSLAWSSNGHWLAASYDDNSTTILLWRI